MEKRFEALWEEGNYGYNHIGKNTMRQFIKKELKNERIKLIREILPDIHRLRANIPMTPTNHARAMAKKLVKRLEALIKDENEKKE